MRTPRTTQVAITTSRVKIPHRQTRSTFEMNFIAAATSRKAIMTFTELSHPPDRGRRAIHCGISASTKNGSAKTVEKASMPTSGHCQSPPAAITSNVPMNGAVHVNEVSVKVSPISSVASVWLPPWRRVRASSRFTIDGGRLEVEDAEEAQREADEDRR